MYPVIVDRDDTVPAATQQHQAELRQLREAVADLETQIRDLEAQLAALVKAHDPGLPPAEVLENVAEPVITGPPPAGGPTALFKRTAKKAIRGSLGVARMVWGAADPAQRHVVAVRSAPEPARTLPKLSVVVEGTEIPADLVQQTLALPGLVVPDGPAQDDNQPPTEPGDLAQVMIEVADDTVDLQPAVEPGQGH